MKRVHRFLAFFLVLAMTAVLIPFSPALAENLDTGSSSAEAAVTAPASGTITSFGALELEEIAMAEKYDLDSLLEMMPTTIPVYLDGSDTPTEIEVSWYCLVDYNASDDFYFQFSPSWDTVTYSLEGDLDPELAAPYIAVYIAQPITRSTLSNSDIIFNYLVNDLGLSSAAACGILANIYAESSFNPKASCVDINGQISYGLCQWNGPRYTNLKTWCQNNGYDYTTITGQLHFLTHELGTSSYSYILTYLRDEIDNTASGAYNAGYYWCYYFEQPGNRAKNSRTRGNLAKNTYWSAYGEEELTTSDAVPLLSDATLPGDSMEYGTFFTLRGTITCPSTITSVTAGIYDADGNDMTSSTASPDATSFNVYQLDKDVLFSQTPAGSYTYRITATVDETEYTVLSYDFTITPRLMTDASVFLRKRCAYTGDPVCPEPRVIYGWTVLKKDIDYTVTYENNQEAGTATCTITGIGNYQGTVQKTFSIVSKK